jgi:hypothetical protein
MKLTEILNKARKEIEEGDLHNFSESTNISIIHGLLPYRNDPMLSIFLSKERKLIDINLEDGFPIFWEKDNKKIQFHSGTFDYDWGRDIYTLVRTSICTEQDLDVRISLIKIPEVFKKKKSFYFLKADGVFSIRYLNT